MTVTIVLDFETAGNSPASACALGMARVEGDRIADVFYSLIRPPRECALPAGGDVDERVAELTYTWVHGLRWTDVRDAPDFAHVWRSARGITDGAHCFAAHNAAFDRGVLRACCAAAGLPGPKMPWLCTLRGARRSLNLPSHRLDAVCAHLGIELEHHHAGSDALAAAKVLLRLRETGMDDATMRLE
ncbi:MAG: 3'-5' exonuclease [Desulfovibrio sp.]|nr:3'-5' exonuclease [Desulfovibrio sp.]